MDKRVRAALIFLVPALCLLLAGCEGEPEGSGVGINKKAKLATLEGKLTFLGAGQKFKLSLLVGQKRVKATMNGKAGGFRFEGLPAGAKTLLAQFGGKTRVLKFPKSSSDPSRMSSVIPDTKVASPSFNLGKLTLPAARGAGKADGADGDDALHIVAENNPLETLLDTDGDGQFDYFDDDIDGDGSPNAQDENPYGEEMEGWGWDEEYIDAWDEDGDGTADWDDPDSEPEYLDWREIEEWEACAEGDEQCWHQEYCELDPEAPGCTSDSCAADDVCNELCLEDPDCEGVEGPGESEICVADEWCDPECAEGTDPDCDGEEGDGEFPE